MKATANPTEVDYGVITKVMLEESTYPQSGCWLEVDGLDDFIQEHSFGCDSGMIARYKPAIGDYLVRQPDGYFYINPKAVFERKYTKS